MPQTAIFGPVFAMIGLTFAVWVIMYARRIPLIRSSGLTPADLAIPGRLAEISPPEVSNPSDNLKNLFEMPVLFYALAAYLFATGQVDGFHVCAAWVFALLRMLHSAVHCTVNVVMLRFWLYFGSSAALWAMAARAGWRHFAG